MTAGAGSRQPSPRPTVMAELGATRDLSWVSIESPEFAPGLDYPPRPDGVDSGDASVAVLST